MKLDAIEILSPHVAASDKFEKAIKKIEESLKPELWAAGNSGGVDPRHLDSMDGKRVFDYERDAVRELMRLLKDGKVSANALGGAELGQDLLVRADWNLAALALSENAGLTAANPADQADVEEELQKAEEELAKGEEERAAGKFDTAIQHYKKSWESTMKAIEIAG
jgi:hypothetical protein